MLGTELKHKNHLPKYGNPSCHHHYLVLRDAPALGFASCWRLVGVGAVERGGKGSKAMCGRLQVMGEWAQAKVDREAGSRVAWGSRLLRGAPWALGEDSAPRWTGQG